MKDWAPIVGAAVIVAASILFVFRWQAAPIGGTGVILLDRWPSTVVVLLRKGIAHVRR